MIGTISIKNKPFIYGELNKEVQKVKYNFSTGVDHSGSILITSDNDSQEVIIKDFETLQRIEDQNLATDQKTIVGAINENHKDIDSLITRVNEVDQFVEQHLDLNVVNATGTDSVILKYSGTLDIYHQPNSNVGTSSATFGYSNYNNGSSSLQAGSRNSNVDAPNSIQGGNQNSNHGQNTVQIGQLNNNDGNNVIQTGYKNENSTDNAIVGGYFNADTPDALVKIGNGTDIDHRSNAFEVLKDGRAKVQSSPTDKNDVVRKEDLDNAVALILNDEGATSALDSWKELQDLIGEDDGTGTGILNDISNLKTKFQHLSIENGEGLDSLVQKYSGEVDDTHYGNTNTGASAVVFGEANTNSAKRALVVGKLNNNSTSNSIISGLWNTVSDGNHNSVSGEHNTVKGSDNIVGGKQNDVSSYHTLVTGENNHVNSGVNQAVFGNDNIASADNQLLAGHHLKSSTPNQAIFGYYNKEQPDALLVIGSGNHDDAEGQNAFWVTRSEAFTSKGKLSTASNLKDGTGDLSIVGKHSGNENANVATGRASIAGGSSSGWQADGGNTVVSADNSIGWGYKVNIDKQYSYGFGWGIDIKNSDFKFVTGYYNEDKNNTVFEVGYGKPNERKNMFEVLKDGRAKVYGTPVEYNDVLRSQDTTTNLENGEGSGSIKQKTHTDDSKNSKANGVGAIALGGFRGDKPNGTPDPIPENDKNTTEITDIDTITVVEGIQAAAFGAGNRAYGNWNFIAGKDNKTFQRGSFAFGGKNAVGNPEEPNAYCYSIAVGESNTVTGRACFVGGDRNDSKAKAQYGIVYGRNNISEAIASIIVGASTTMNHVTTSAAFGDGHVVNNSCALVSGVGNKTGGYGSTALGGYLTTNANYQTVVGVLNNPNPDAMFVVGNGTNVNNTKNIFEVLQDGRAKVYKEPQEDNDVVRLQDLNKKFDEVASSLVYATDADIDNLWLVA